MFARPPRRPAPLPTAKTVHLPAPVGGLNSIDGASIMAPTDGLLIYNMVAGEYGLMVRPAQQTFNDPGLATEGRSLFPFTGSKANSSTDTLFMATHLGIYKVGIYSGGPQAGPNTLVQAYGTTTGSAGYGASCAFNTSADRYLIVCDEVNGLYIYKESTDTWAQVTMGGGASQISGVDPATFCHVTVFKNRLWFTQKNTTLGWYLGTNAVFGAATSFDFGPRMRAGGDLRGLFNWSYDGGNGIDALLVAVSGGGDVVIYQGTDPTTAAGFGLKGTWSVGGVPAGRRIATEHGGDLLILSILGVIPLSRLVVGNTDLDFSQYSTYKISRAFTKAVANYATVSGWCLLANPSDSSLLINVPNNNSTTVAFQFVMSLTTKAWSQYGHDTSLTCRGYPILGAAVWENQLYMADNQGVVRGVLPWSSSSQLDTIGGVATTIEYEVVSAFVDMDTPNIKRVAEIRPRFVSYMSQTAVGFAGLFNAAARYDYDLTELPANSSTATPGATSAPTSYRPIFGTTGVGSAVGVVVRGRSSSPTTLIGFDVVYESGGFQ